jgi:hypothetical protein
LTHHATSTRWRHLVNALGRPVIDPQTCFGAAWS